MFAIKYFPQASLPLLPQVLPHTSLKTCWTWQRWIGEGGFACYYKACTIFQALFLLAFVLFQVPYFMFLFTVFTECCRLSLTITIKSSLQLVFLGTTVPLNQGDWFIRSSLMNISPQCQPSIPSLSLSAFSLHSFQPVLGVGRETNRELGAGMPDGTGKWLRCWEISAPFYIHLYVSSRGCIPLCILKQKQNKNYNIGF